MKAVLIATGELLETRKTAEPNLACLMPLMGRPFIQHVVECLVTQGLKDFTVILCQSPEKVERLLGDGTRWGVGIGYQLVKDPSRSYGPLKMIADGKEDQPILIVHADCLMQMDLKEAGPPEGHSAPTLYCLEGASTRTNDAASIWSGWGWLPPKIDGDLPAELNTDGFFAHFRSFHGCREVRVQDSKFLRVQSYRDLLAAHRMVLNKAFTGLNHTGTEAAENIWLSRNVSLHPSARLIRPVFIGENCRINRNVRLGPNVAVGDNCVIDAQSNITDSVIFSGSYVGQSLELSDAIVDRNLLVNARIGSEITVTEDFILAGLSERRIREWCKTKISQCVAALLLLILLPFLLVFASYLKLTRKGPLFYKKEAVRLPAPSDREVWPTFKLYSFLPPTDKTGNEDGAGELAIAASGDTLFGWLDVIYRFIPNMLSVAQGGLRFVGVGPRNAEEIKALASDWKVLYLKSKPGIVTEARVNFGAHPTEEEIYSAEAFYCVSSGWKYDLKLLARYFGQLLGLVPMP
jgi:NDP-sugar pyrophosphorylase family protein